MKLLHTSDWHVGRTIRGHSRADEHRAVLAEIAGIAAREQVDLVIVAGDLFDTAAPTAESERIAYDALLGLAEVAPVVALAGNHDGARRLDAVARLLALGRVTMAADVRRPDEGGVLRLTVADGTPVQVALLPFLSQRGIVRADALMAQAAYEHAQSYADRVRLLLEVLCAGFTPDSVNLVAAHLFVAGGVSGGGERGAHLVEAYGVSPVDFPSSVSYGALGHLHRAQRFPARPIHYCGSPLTLDFGETDEPRQVNLVAVEPGLSAKVTSVALTAGRRLTTVAGTVAELEALAAAGTLGDAWLRVDVTEPARAGLADEVRAVLGEQVVDVRLAGPSGSTGRSPQPRRDGRTPAEQFATYLRERGVADPALEQAFADLYEEIHDADAGRAGVAGAAEVPV